MLIVEDDERSQDCLSKRFLTRGDLVISVCHPRQALEAATICDFDVVLLDQSLPEMTGLSLIPSLRGLVGNLRIIHLSGDPDRVSSREAIRHGADSFLHKPCSVDEVEAAVTDTLSTGKRHLIEEQLPSMKGSPKA